MPDPKTISVSYRVSARFKSLLEAAATRDSRSQTSMLEHLLFVYCNKHGIRLSNTAEDVAYGWRIAGDPVEIFERAGKQGDDRKD